MDLTPVMRFGLLLVRPGMLIAVAPAFGGTHVPALVKIGLTALMTLGLLPSVTVPATAGDMALSLVIAREAAIGLALAFVVRALVAGAELAGHLSAHQIGYTYAASIDPQTGARNSMLATLYGSLTVLTFLAVDGHHALLRTLAASYEAVPMGIGGVSASLVTSVREILGVVFLLGARLAAPIVIVLLIVELGVGLISRTAPSLSFMVIGYPLRLLIGLLVLAALISTIPAMTASLMESTLMLGGRTAAAFR